LQDDERIDALGAVGIFRSLVSMGAFEGHEVYHGTVKERSMNALKRNPLKGL
jgi:uncharacterized protein